MLKMRMWVQNISSIYWFNENVVMGFRTFKPNPLMSFRIVRLKSDTFKISRKLLVLLFKILERNPLNWFHLSSTEDITSDNLISKISNFNWLCDNLSFCKLDMLVKKPLMLSIRKLSDRSQELKESGLVNFGRFSLSLQLARWTFESSLSLIQLRTDPKPRLL